MSSPSDLPGEKCDDPTCPCRQLAWLEEMERIEQEVFPDARPRLEVFVEVIVEDAPDAN